MRYLAGVLLLMATSLSTASDSALLDQDFRRLASDEVVNLSEAYAGKVVLVVNTASKCGNTPQYDGLEKSLRGIRRRWFRRAWLSLE